MACGGAEVTERANVPEREVLSAQERFEVAYVGRWSASGACSGSETIYDIGEDLIRVGERVCMVEDIENANALLEAELTDCVQRGEPVRDREIELDVAGTDILYLTNAQNRRVRLERCPA